MTYTSLSEIERGYLLVFATLVLIIYIYCIIRMLDAGRRNMQFVCTCLIAAVAFGLYQGMIMYQQEDLDMFDVPVFVLVAAYIGFLLFGAYMLYSIVAWQRANISSMSVKEAFDRLPAGLAYYTPSGVPVLVNETMQQLSRDISGETVTDANAFWEKIKAYGGEGAIKDDNSAIVNIGDNGIYNVMRRQVSINGTDMYELTASEIGTEFKLTRELEAKREKARVLNSRLKALMGTIEYVSMNRELLKLKTALHDNIGQSILIAKRYLHSPGSVDRKRMLEFWQDNVDHLTNDEPEEWELPYYVISQEADRLGINLSIIGELPKDRRLIPIVDAAVSAQVGNTLKHTNGTTVTIAVSDKANEYLIVLTDDGEAAGIEAEPLGGLANLRREVENAGGKMEIEQSPDFALRITLPKGEDYVI
ncbi:MAG: hypothetical protein K6E49_09050 [Lachnospiraceae bacterium]|nr:hypothetical protein [Lachnospiraceae bacterium]